METYTVDHKDGNRGDNNIDNIRWANQRDQCNNRGKRKYADLKKGEERVLLPPSENIGISREKVVYDVPVSVGFYAAYITSDDILDDVASVFNIRTNTALGYVSREYQASDVERLVYKLGLNHKTLHKPLMSCVCASQIMREMDKSLKSARFTSDIHEALGDFCTDHVVSTALLRKLYNDYCVGSGLHIDVYHSVARE